MKTISLVQLGVVGLVALLFGALFLSGLRNVWRGFRSTSWPTTDATVVDVERASTVHRDSAKPWRAGFTTHSATVQMRYQVAGRDYTTDRISWGQSLGSSDPAEAALLALRYPEGQRLQVHYNPANPSQAVVLPGLHAGAFMLPVAALAFLILFLPIALWIPKLASGGADFPNLIIRGACCLPILLGISMAVLGVKNLVQAGKSSAWMAVEGHWLSADLKQPSAENAAMSSTDLGLADVYRYEAGGKTRFGSRHSFGQDSVGRNSGSALIAREFAPDQPLTVFHDPVAPDESVLRRGITPRTWLLPAIGLVLCLFGVVGMVLLTGSVGSSKP